jgi:predicted DNA repair protein MutK
MSKVAAKKTAGVLGDDLALTAQQVFGVKANRELPVVLGVAKGSLVNKLILIPLAMLISRFAPFLITPMLMVGGAWLSLEGAEKVLHLIKRSKTKNKDKELINSQPKIEEQLDQQYDSINSKDLTIYEKNKIKGAVKTDFVLSTEIIVITLGALPLETSFVVRAGILLVVGLLMTVGVYGFVAAIVKLDDLGFYLCSRNQPETFFHILGKVLIEAAPWLMRFLTVVGTLAMFLVGGGIIVHGVEVLEYLKHSVPLWGPLFDSFLGLVIGLILTPPMFFLSKGIEVICKKAK